MAISAVVIQQVGKVELHVMPDVTPPYIRMMRVKQPLFVRDYNPDSLADTMDSIDLETTLLRGHRLVGLSIDLGYWPESWQNDWAIEELLKWEGRGDEIRSDQYYADFIIDENQQARENEHRQVEAGFTKDQKHDVFVISESVRQRSMDTRTDVFRGFEPSQLAIPSGEEDIIEGELVEDD